MIKKPFKTLNEDDKRVWKTLAKSVVPLRKASSTQGSFIRSATKDHSKSIKNASQSIPEKFGARQAAQKRASGEALLRLITEKNRQQLPSRKASKTTAMSKFNDDLAPIAPSGLIKDMDRRTANRLKRGRLPIEAHMDLHGMTREQAFQTVQNFVERSAKSGKRCVIVITGKGRGQKGGGVLRNEVPIWLNLSQNRRYILGFTHAQPKDGGTGAIYIYLKRLERVIA